MTGSPAGNDADGGHDIDALRITLSETREVLNHQIRTFNDVDNKAARTFRLNAILLGLILTAASFVSQSPTVSLVDHINAFTIGGVILLELSFILAIVVYTTTKIQTGLGPTDIQRLINQQYDEADWLVLLLRSAGEWMRQNERQQTINGSLITGSHALLILAIVAVSIGVALPHL